MNHYVGLDVSLKTISVCILNEKGRRVEEGEVESTPESVDIFLKRTNLKIEKIALITQKMLPPI